MSSPLLRHAKRAFNPYRRSSSRQDYGKTVAAHEQKSRWDIRKTAAAQEQKTADERKIAAVNEAKSWRDTYRRLSVSDERCPDLAAHMYAVSDGFDKIITQVRKFTESKAAFTYYRRPWIRIKNITFWIEYSPRVLQLKFLDLLDSLQRDRTIDGQRPYRVGAQYRESTSLCIVSQPT